MYEPKAIVPASDAAQGERRAGMRHLAVMRVATLHTTHGEELCLVRNISEGGLKARIWSDLRAGASLKVEFRSGHDVPGKVVWRRGDHIGVHFSEVEDLAAILRGDEEATPDFHPRAPRVRIELPARVRIGARYHRGMLRDISQGGAKVQLVPPNRWEEGEPPVTLMLTDLPPIEGTLRWHDQEIAGIAFNSPIPLDALARWIATQRRQMHLRTSGRITRCNRIVTEPT